MDNNEPNPFPVISAAFNGDPQAPNPLQPNEAPEAPNPLPSSADPQASNPLLSFIQEEERLLSLADKFSELNKYMAISYKLSDVENKTELINSFNSQIVNLPFEIQQKIAIKSAENGPGIIIALPGKTIK